MQPCYAAALSSRATQPRYAVAPLRSRATQPRYAAALHSQATQPRYAAALCSPAMQSRYTVSSIGLFQVGFTLVCADFIWKNISGSARNCSHATGFDSAAGSYIPFPNGLCVGMLTNETDTEWFEDAKSESLDLKLKL